MATYREEFTKGIIRNNGIFVLMLGLCPTLAVTTKVTNAFAMGLAASFVLICSNVIISALRRVIPKAVRIPCFIVVIASFVTIVDMVMKGFFYEQSKDLSIFVPLIVVNCIILGRAEAFAYKNTVLRSLLDGAGTGLGFTLALMLIGTVREVLGAGTFLGYPLWLDAQGRAVYEPMTAVVLAPGAFIVLGLLMATFRAMGKRRSRVRLEEVTWE
ncbi:MAG: electron transport complex subunit RsxE [Planctomycetota bacterium]